MAFCIEEFNRGIEEWELMCNNSNWPKDFHNGLYSRLAQSELVGIFKEELWEFLWPIIYDWKAHRPVSKNYLKNRYCEREEKLQQIWDADIEPLRKKDIAEVEWETIEEFTKVIQQIKGKDSPVFVSKVCHFLVPTVFPVTDRAKTGLPRSSYKEQFQFIKKEWMETEKCISYKLSKRLEVLIGENIVENYPMACKIADICLIGRRKFQ